MVITATGDLAGTLDYIEDAATRAELDRERAVRRAREQRRSVRSLRAPARGWVRAHR